MVSRLVAGLLRLGAAVSGLTLRLTGWWRRRAWPSHLDRVATDPAYAAAAAAILAGLLGLVPPREVIVAVLAAAISLILRSRPDDGPSDGCPFQVSCAALRRGTNMTPAA
jgi:hypothetical protein